jgi:hypothetical protein
VVDQTGGAPAAGYVVAVVMAGIALAALAYGVIAAIVRRHRAKPGRHREQPHEGYADNEERVGELQQMAIDFARERRDRLGGG